MNTVKIFLVVLMPCIVMFANFSTDDYDCMESSQTCNGFNNRGIAFPIPNHSFEHGVSAFLIDGAPSPVETNRGYYGNNSIRLSDGQKAFWESVFDENTMGQRKTLSTGVWVYIDGEGGSAGIALECFTEGRYIEVSRASTSVSNRWFYLKTPFMSDKNAEKTVSNIRICLYSETVNNVYFDFVQMGDWQRFNGNPEKMAIMAYQPWYGDKNEPNRWDGWARDATRSGGERYDPNLILNQGTPDEKRKIASVYYPMIGAYKSNDREVLEYHVQIIKAMGFDVIQVNYYAERSQYQKEVLDILFDLSLNYDMKMSILYEPKIHNNLSTQEQRNAAVETDLINYINKYKNHKALLQYNGRILVGSFDYNNLTDIEWGAIIERVRNETGYTMAISSQTVNIPNNRTTDEISTDNIESAFIWSLWSESFRNWDEANVRNFTENLQKRVIDWNESNHFTKLPMGMVFPGFDDTPIRAWAQTPPGIIRKIEGTGQLFYHVSWDSFMKYKDRLDWINIATFNDWNEGTILEPSRESGHELAFITAQKIAEWKGRTAATLEQLEAITIRYLNTRMNKYD